MQRYSGQPRGSIFIKGYGLLPFARNTGKNAGINISKNLTSIFSQKILDYAKNLLQIHLKLLQKEQIQKQQKQLMN